MEPEVFVDKLIGGQAYMACPLLSVRDFVAFCEARGVKTSTYELARLDELGIMRPVVCARQMRIPYDEDEQIPTDDERIPTGHHRSVNIRDPGEIAGWLSNGDLWVPGSENFEPWHDFILNPDGDRTIDRFYSRFQCYTLWRMAEICVQDLCELPTLWACAPEEDRQEFLLGLESKLKELADAWRTVGAYAQQLWQVCQLISNRYFFLTQSDGRTYEVSESRGWSWDDCRHQWNAVKAMHDLGLDRNSLYKLWAQAEANLQIHDPLKAWYELIQMMSVQKKRHARGGVLLGLFLEEVEEMLRHFFKEATGETVYPTFARPGTLDAMYGEGTERDELKRLEYVVTQYSLNPRPRLILVVEGRGEYEQIPRLIEALWGTPGKRGIEIINLSGYSNFEGSRRDRLSGWYRLIDYHHSHHTVVFIVLDPHGRARQLREALSQAPSIHDPGRTIQLREYFHIWERSIEFDGFSDEEIAAALTQVADGYAMFSPQQVQEARARSETSQKDELTALYAHAFRDKRREERRSLDKPRLLGVLVDYAIADPDSPWQSTGGEREFRPLIETIRRAIDVARRNHPPPGEKFRLLGQESGFFGDRLNTRPGPGL